MKVLIAVAATALALTGCGAQSATAAPAPTTAAPAPGTAAPIPGEKPTREFVIGKWGTDGDCALAIDLRADGSSDGPFGNWAYSDGTISFSDAPDFRVSVTVVDDTTMSSNNSSSGKTTTMTRCP